MAEIMANLYVKGLLNKRPPSTSQGHFPLNMYQSEEQIGEKVKFNGAGDDEEDPVDEYSSQSRNQNWSFLRTTRSGRNISVNQKYGL